MSEFYTEVVRIGKIQKHPNADNLSVTYVLSNYPVVIRTGQFNEGDLAVYLSVDALVDTGDARFSFLDKRTGLYRIKAKRLRGIFSMGLLINSEDGMTEGQNVAELLNVKKYEPEIESHAILRGECEPDPGYMPVYDIEGLRRFSGLIEQGKTVVFTEKIHGTNARYLFKDNRLYCASRNHYKTGTDERDLWWKIARKYDLETKLSQYPGLAFYGEIYGEVQDLKYGLKNDHSLVIFDIYDTDSKKYLNYADQVDICKKLSLDSVPLLYIGIWNPDDITWYIQTFSNGLSPLAMANGSSQIREGFVVKPLNEQVTNFGDRVILKFVGEEYHLR